MRQVAATGGFGWLGEPGSPAGEEPWEEECPLGVSCGALALPAGLYLLGILRIRCFCFKICLFSLIRQIYREKR